MIKNYFRLKGNDEFVLKTTVSVYDTDILVVSGASYYIWILEHFKVKLSTFYIFKSYSVRRFYQYNEDDFIFQF